MNNLITKKAPTAEIVKILFDGKKKWIEVSLNDGTFNATHILQPRKNKVIDCGIDSRDVSWELEDFIEFYRFAHWKIDQISIK